MRTIYLLALLLGCAGTAHADVSDSGNLSIGGQGVVAGTMTVQGNAFSVGGSTFSVLAGTVNTGGLLKVGAQGIQWNDGTVSTTSTSGSGGCSNVSSCLVDSTFSVSGISSYTFTLSASTAVVYNLLLNVSPTATSNLAIRFNGDSSANYIWSTEGLATNGAGDGSDSTASNNVLCQLNRSGGLNADDQYNGNLTIRFSPRSMKKVSLTGTSFYYWGPNGRAETSYLGCQYAGSSNVTSMTVFWTGGYNMVGDLKLLKLGP